MKKTSALLLLTAALLPGVSRAEIKLPAIFGSHMVLQQNLSNPVWGWEVPGAAVTVEATVLGLPEAPAVETPAETPALETLTKAELVALAKAELDLDLDPEAKKAAMVAAIEAARAEKSKA